MAFNQPNYTMVPNEFFDTIMAELSGAEMKVLMLIIRKTIGFVSSKGNGERKTHDRISLSQITKYTGLGRTRAFEAAKSLEEKGHIRGDHTIGVPTDYWLLFKTIPESELVENEPVQKVDGSRPESGTVPPETIPKSEHTKERYKEILKKGAAPASVEPEPGTDAYREQVRTLQERALKDGNLEGFVDRGTADRLFSQIRDSIKHHARAG